MCVGEGRSIHARVAALHTALPLEAWHHPPNRVSDIIQHSDVFFFSERSEPHVRECTLYYVSLPLAGLTTERIADQA